MQKVILALLALCAYGWGAIGALTIPHEIDSAAIPKVIYIDQNNDSIINKVNEVKDTVNGLAAGTAAFSGLTASRLMSTNASKQPASVSDLTSWIAGTANQITSTSDGDGSLTLSLPSAVAFPGTVAVTTRLNIAGAADNASFPLNVIGSIANSGTNGIYSYGSGVPGDANYERAGMIHTGSAAEFRSSASGTGTVENLRLVVGSTTRYEITNAGAHTATGSLTVTSTVTADSLISSKFYTENSFTIAATGFSACSQGVLSGSTCTATAHYVRVGKAVTLYIPYLMGTSNATAFTLTGIPAAIRPGRAQNVQVSSLGDNGAGDYAGSLDIATDGTATIYRRTSATALVSTWTSSNSKFIYYNTINYTIQ